MDQNRCMGCMKPKQAQPVCEHCGYDERKQNPAHQLPVGTVLQGQFQVGRVLGQGGFGITYLGWDMLLDIPVAIKEFYPSGFVTRDCTHSTEVSGCEGSRQVYFDNSRARFLREAKALARFSDVPEIVHVRSFFQANNTAYIIMEYVQGMDLRQYIAGKGGRLSAQETLELLKPVMFALDSVHSTELVHRDISPDNIMILPGGRIKLLDFGAARDVENADAERELNRSTEAILKHGFAPIEQYQKRGSLGPWTDVYALCGTAYYCMTGKVPPDAPERMTEDVHPDWLSIPGLTQRQRSALEQGMAMRAKDRTKSVRELYEQLYTAAQPEPIPATAPVHPETQSDSRSAQLRRETTPVRQEENKQTVKKKKGFSGVIAAAVLALIVGAGLYLLPKLGIGTEKTPVSAPNSGVQHGGVLSEVTTGADAIQEVVPREVTLSVWAPSTAQVAGGWLPQMMERFEEAYPQYIVTWDLSVCMEGDVSSLARNNPDAVADVYLYANDQVGVLAELGVLARLEGKYLEQVRRDCSDTYCDTVTYSDGGLYGFPVSSNTWFLYYNKSMLSEADIKSLDQMLDKHPVAFPMTNSWYTGSFFFANGCTLFGSTGADAAAGVNFGGDAGAEAATAMVRVASHPNFRNDENGIGVEGMCNGTVAAMFSGDWDYPRLQEALGDNLGAAVLPGVLIGGEQKQLMAFAGSRAIGVNPNAADFEAAMDLAAFLASAQSQLLRYELNAVTPAAMELVEEPAVKASIVAAAQSEVMAYASVAQPTIQEMAAYWDPMRNFGIEICSGRITDNNVIAWLEELVGQISQNGM